jgi:RNA polymerase sigma-70 factor, ECF subfamily
MVAAVIQPSSRKRPGSSHLFPNSERSAFFSLSLQGPAPLRIQPVGGHFMTVQTPSEAASLATRIAEHHAQLLSHARKMFAREGAEDLVQSTIERALTNMGQFDPKSNLQAWLRRIMTNLMVDEWRRQRRRQLMPLTDFPAPENDGAEPWTAEPWEHLTSEDVLKAVPSLASPFREVFELHQREHLSYREIAARLRVRPSTVGTRLLRARQHLRGILSDRLADHPAPPARQPSSTRPCGSIRQAG